MAHADLGTVAIAKRKSNDFRPRKTKHHKPRQAQVAQPSKPNFHPVGGARVRQINVENPPSSCLVALGT